MKYSIKKRSTGIKALPINFKGKFLGFAFSILNQFDIYGKVAAEFYSISEDRFLFALDGSGSVESAINNLYGKVVGSLNYNLDDRDTKNLKKDISKFLKQVNSEVKNYNSTNKNILVKKEVIIKKPVKLMVHRKKTAKKKTAKKKVYKQANSSNIIYDKRLQAKKPGKRKSAAGNIYYENRENRSDKGRLLGIGDIPLDQIGSELFVLESTINKLKAEKKHLRTIGERKMKQEKISVLQKQFKSLREYLNSRARFK